MIAHLKKELNSDYYVIISVVILISSTVLVEKNFLAFGLLFGPLLLAFVNNYSVKTFALHAIPFLVNRFYVINDIPINRTEYYFFTGISFLIYGLVAFLCVYRNSVDPEKRKAVFLGSSLYCFVSFFIFMLILVEHQQIEPNFNFEYLIQGLLLMSFFVIGQYYSQRQNRVSVPVMTAANPSKGEMIKDCEGTEVISEVELNRVISQRKLFLNTNLTSKKLAEELGLPKYEVDRFFSRCPKMGFREYIAKFRVEYAIERMKGKDLMTIESLAHESGFNSKTTFIKYFKAYTGVLPSEYRQKLKNDF